MSNSQPTNGPRKNRNVFYIGLLSFFGGISQDIFLPALPLYLSNVLHMDKALIGLSEGIVTSASSIFRIIAGFITDRFGKRKPVVFVGYFLSFISRPLLAVITSPLGVIFLRFVDGVGKGVKDTPKDALIADSSVQADRGRQFGIYRMLDTLGSVVGPILLFVMLDLLATNDRKYEIIFFVAALPLIITLLVLAFKVRESNAVEKKVSSGTTGKSLPRSFYFFMLITAVFTLGNSSDSFLILRAQQLGVALLAIPLAYALFNFIYASASIPLGSLSDKIGREKVIILGWAAYALAYLGFAWAQSSLAVWALFAFYGLYYATTQGVAKALIADLVSATHRGRAYGIYNALISLLSLPASLIAGLLWDKVNSSAAFLFGAVLAAMATVLLVVFVYTRKRIDGNLRLA